MSDETLYRAFRIAYSLVYVPAAPFVAVYLISRADSRRRLGEYLGLHRAVTAAGRPRVWLHAVSVGEMVSAVPVVEGLRARWPGLSLCLTTTIEDALTMADAVGLSRDWDGFLPLDVPPATAALTANIDPDVLLLSETDLWPNLLESVHRRGSPVFLINGRISYKIARGYGLAPRLARVMLGRIKHHLVQTSQDRDRLLALGVLPERISITGSTKHEAALRTLAADPDLAILETVRALGRPVVAGGSTHPGEEAILLDLAAGPAPRPLIVLAPRLVTRAQAIATAARTRGLVAALLSQVRTGQVVPADLEVLVVDRLGLLPLVYTVSTVAFVGGSFDGSGGHNFLEAAAAGCPVVLGPLTRNFHEDVTRFRDAGALIEAATPEEVSDVLHRLLEEPGRARAIGVRGRALLLESRGAVARTVDALAAQMPDWTGPERPPGRPTRAQGDRGAP